MRLIAIALPVFVLSLGLPGCAVYEALGGMPYAEADVALAAKPGTARALECVRTSVIALGSVKSPGVGGLPPMTQGWWSTEFTRFDPARGVLETGHYPDSNIVGVRLRATYDASQGALRLQLKAAGPYYTDLGAPSHLDRLRERVVACAQG